MQEVIRVNPSCEDAGNSLARSVPLIALPSQDQLGVRVRDAVLDDLPFIDALQKKHSKAVGWMPTGQLEGHINKGHVVVAEATVAMADGGWRMGDGEGNSGDALMTGGTPIPPQGSALNPTPSPARLGYCIGVDKYFKREEAGIIYQMNIDPASQRKLLGATLLQAMFDRWPYGVRLCCCWCAQDLQANYFWESMGFVPLAFRSGSKKRDRVHIFWQKQIRKSGPQANAQTNPQGTDSHAGETSGGTSGGGGNSGGWWFPSQTGGGAIREDRIVLPIPPGTHWSDAKPRIFPEVSGLIASAAAQRKALEAPRREAERARKREQKEAEKAKAEQAAAQEETVAAGGLRFGAASEPITQTNKQNPSPSKDNKGKKKPAAKNDPRLVAAARELRDRWLEHAAAHPGMIEQGNSAQRRYDIGRSITPLPPEVATPPEVIEYVIPDVSHDVLPKRLRSASDAA